MKKKIPDRRVFCKCTTMTADAPHNLLPTNNAQSNFTQTITSYDVRVFGDVIESRDLRG